MCTLQGIDFTSELAGQLKQQGEMNLHVGLDVVCLPDFFHSFFESLALSGIHRSFFAMRRDLRWMRAMRTREIPFTEEVSDATKSC